MTDNEKIFYALLAILRAHGAPIRIDLNWLEETMHAQGEFKIEHSPALNALILSFRPCEVLEFSQRNPEVPLSISEQAELIIRKKEADGPAR